MATNNDVMARKAHDLQSDKGEWRVGDIITVNGAPKYYVCEIMPVLGPMLKGITKNKQKRCIKHIFG